MKYNPFRPNNMVPPGAFHGRIDEIQAIDQCLFQTKNGNPQHFLIQGERGIGKTSLLYLIDITASGHIPLADQNSKVSFLSVTIDLGDAETQLDIIRAIGRGLKKSLSGNADIKEKAKLFWDWITNWEILGVRFHKDRDSLDPQDAADELVTMVITLCEQTEGEIDGVLFLIDEADRPSEQANLGAFLKFFTERLERKGCNQVVIGMAGLPSINAKLRASHKSSPRLFETLTLKPLEPHERKQVVRSGLNEAKDKNGFDTKITPEALELISVISEGYPHFVQQFAYSAFAEDTDNVIDVEDVTEGAFKENGALAQLGAKYFSDMYHVRISSEEYRQVLDTMAQYGDSWLSRKSIIEESGVTESNVDNALNSLKGNNTIVHDDTRRGFYRLPTKSFAAWINAVRTTREKSENGQDGLFDG